MPQLQSHVPLSIGELARQTGASARAIRHYDDHGLLRSSRSANGYRIFPAIALTQVTQLRRFIAAGFTLDEIKSFPECMRIIDGALTCPETKGKHRERLLAIENQIAELERRRHALRSMLQDSPAAHR